MEIDLAHLQSWQGRTAEAVDLVTPRLADEFEATFAPLIPPGGEAVPPGLHWCLSPYVVPEGETGRDGHPQRGGFLPPVPLPRRMWAGGEVETLGELRRGDTVVRRSSIGRVSLKQGRTGPLCFVAVHHEYDAGRGVAVRERHDIVYRDAVPGAAAVPGTPRPAEARWTVQATPLLLFRYSAMTFNGHRIHYDLPYATGEEGYAGLVVHGPIQATLLLNLAASLYGRTPRRFSYRGQAALIAGGAFQVAAVRHGDGLECWTEGADGGLRMLAEARD